MNAQLAQKVVELLLSQGFCEDVLELCLIRNMIGSDVATHNFITHKVAVNLNVFRTLMKNRINGDMKINLTITIQFHGESMSNTKT